MGTVISSPLATSTRIDVARGDVARADAARADASRTEATETGATREAAASGVSWPAVIAGAVVAAALSLILLALGTGLGLSAISPWSNRGASAAAVGNGAIGWLIAAEIMASALGGYLAGRLRTRWASIHTDEVYFRDTAHGLLAWAVGAVVTAGLLASAATSMAGRATEVGVSALPSVGGAANQGTDNRDAGAYAIDGLFRSNNPTGDRADAAVRGEVGAILLHSLTHGDLTPSDRTYVSNLIVARTGISQADADQRVTSVFADARQALDTARKAAIRLSLWVFIALLAGAFCASYAATIGGKQRDRVVSV